MAIGFTLYLDTAKSYSLNINMAENLILYLKTAYSEDFKR